MTTFNMYLSGNLVLTQSNGCKVMLSILILIMYLIETAKCQKQQPGYNILMVLDLCIPFLEGLTNKH